MKTNLKGIAAGAFSVVLASVGGLQAAPELAATAEIASFGDISKKVTMLGRLINNPIVPTLVLGTGQQQLAQTYGRFRSNSPMYWLLYADVEALKKSGGNPDFDKCSEKVLIYPSADGIAKMALNHPGSEKVEGDILHLRAGADNPDDRWVKFSADGAYCAIASSADQARRAIADFECSAGARKTRMNTERPIIRLDVCERALEFLVEIQNINNGIQAKRTGKKSDSAFLDKLFALQEKSGKENVLRKFSGATILLDLDEKGISTDLELKMKNGVKAPVIAGVALPAGALDAMTADTFLFCSGLSLFQGAYDWENEAAFKADMKEIAGLVRTDLVADVKAEKDLKPYATALEEVAFAAADLIESVDYPAADDWSSVALAFDAEKHPYVLSDGKARNAEKLYDLGVKTMDRVSAAVDKLWPGSKIVEKNAAGHVIDWAAAVDVGVARSDLAKDKNVAKAVKNAKETLSRVLGSTKTELASKVTGDKYAGHLAMPGFVRSAKSGIGEANVTAALPEAKTQRPAAVLYLPLYALARDVALPILAKQASKTDAQQYEAMMKSMPQADANSAIAAAGWVRADGSVRGLVRITANELKNFGAAFNAFTAASMIGGGASDDDDD